MIHIKQPTYINSKNLGLILRCIADDLSKHQYNDLVIERYQPEIATPIFSNTAQSYIHEEKKYNTLVDKIIFNELFHNTSKRPTRKKLYPLFSVEEEIFFEKDPKSNDELKIITMYSKNEEIEKIAKKYMIPFSHMYDCRLCSFKW